MQRVLREYDRRAILTLPMTEKAASDNITGEVIVENMTGKSLVKAGLIKLIISCVIIVVLVIAVAIGNAIAFKYETVINSVLAQPIVDEEERSASSASGQKMAQRIVEEGTVLLKNENGALPLDTAETPQVTLFGWAFDRLAVRHGRRQRFFGRCFARKRRHKREH